MTDYSFDFVQYEKRLNKKTGKTFPIIFVLIILLIGLAMFLLPTAKTDKFYFVEAGSFETYNQALGLANEIKNRNGAGYIYYETRYHVLVNFYPDEASASTVAENLTKEYPLAKVYTLNKQKFKNFNSLTSSENKNVKDITTHMLKTIDVLSSSSLALDQNSTSVNKIKLDLNNNISEFNDLKDDFFNLFNGNTKYNVCKELLLDTNSILNNLANIENETEFNNQIKYATIAYITNYSAFLNSF